VIFSPDGTQLLSSSSNGLVAVWDASTMTPTSTIALPQAATASGAFLPDGHTARFLDWYSGTAYDWDMTSASAVEFACRTVGRDLTREEWTEHFGGLPFRETCPQ
jgi:WD40 repeat protein